MIFRTMRLRKKSLSFLTILGLCIPALAGLCPYYAYADESTQQQLVEKYEQEAKARETAQIEQHKLQFINELCQIMPTSFKKPIILSAVEFGELDIQKLIGISDMPLTTFGYAGLRWLSLPIANHAEICRRQGVVRTLVQDEFSFDRLRKALHVIKKGEDALITYWNKESKLHGFIKDKILPKARKNKKTKKLAWFDKKRDELSKALYGEEIDKELNTLSTTTPALEWLAAAPLFDLVGLGVGSYLSYGFSMMLWKSMSDWKSPDVWKQTFMPSTSMLKDIFKKTVIDLWIPLDPRERMRQNGPAGATYKVWDGSEEFWREIDLSMNDMSPLHKLQVLYNGSAMDRFNFGADLTQYYLPGPSNAYPAVKNIAGAGLAASMAIRYYFYMWGYFKICNIWKEGKELINKMHDLHVSLVDIAKLMRVLKSLQSDVASMAVFNDSYAQKVLELIMGSASKASPDFKELMELMQTKTFDNADTCLYSRGRVLRAHMLLKKVRYTELIPLLQAIAELDGYCVIARLVKAYEHKENKFVFAEFVSSDTPCMNIRSCWEPLAPTKNPVVNDIRLGADGKPIRMIITGPNGGGKSTFLKSVGHAVVMAQSWGIVPANKAELTMFAAVRTSLDPKEDLSAGISKFTAQKERIGNIQELMKQSSTQSKVLVILDEPYTGTIDDQMADRVHQFGQKAAQSPHAALCIATHVKKPIELARNGSFANYQIEILEPKIGQFVRTFKVKEGAAQWWFNDKPRVTRFIDWLNPASMRQNPGVHESVAGTPSGKQVGTQPSKAAVA